MKLQALTFLFYFLCTHTLFSQIVNEGTLKINPSTLVYFGDAYTNKSTGTHDNDGELHLNNNFINNGITSVPTSGTTYFNSTVNAVQTISGTSNSANFFNLEVANTLTGVSVVDNFGLLLENTVNLSSGDLRLVGEAQLVQTHAGADANTATSGKLLKDQQGVSTTYAYNYWSSPVNNNTGAFSLNGGTFDGTDTAINPFTPQQISFNSGSPYNGVPAIVDGGGNVTTPLIINDNWLYTYSPNTTGYAGWDRLNQNALINPGIGFTMKGTGLTAQNYVFKGLPNNGDYTFPIVTGESALLGNPYPSAIDADKFITDNLLLLDKLQFWVDGGSPSHYFSEYMGGYSIYNLSGGVIASVIPSIAGLGSAVSTIPKRYVPVGQGFFVDAIGTGTILFDNSQRFFQTEDGINSNFNKTSNTKNKETSKSALVNSFIRIGYEDPEMFHRQLLLSFLPESTANLNFNRGYDGFITDYREDELFYIIDNDPTKKYVIQGVGAYNNLYEFPLGLIITQLGTHTIMLDGVENFTDAVYIKDTVLNTTHNLIDASFNINLPSGNYLDRFKIVFKRTESLNLYAFTQKDISVYYTANSIIINNKTQVKLYNILIFNALGQKLIEVKNNMLSKTQIALPFTYRPGIYLVHINSDQGKKTYKIINK
jgi:hypothetical protein